MISIYGLKNCDTCRKALKWLQAEGIEHEFKDVRADGLTDAQVKGLSLIHISEPTRPY